MFSFLFSVFLVVQLAFLFSPIQFPTSVLFYFLLPFYFSFVSFWFFPFFFSLSFLFFIIYIYSLFHYYSLSFYYSFLFYFSLLICFLFSVLCWYYSHSFPFTIINPITNILNSFPSFLFLIPYFTFTIINPFIHIFNSLPSFSFLRPKWEKCGQYVEGGNDRWNEISQNRTSDELVDVILAEMTGQDISMIQSGTSSGAEYFEGLVSSDALLPTAPSLPSIFPIFYPWTSHFSSNWEYWQLK